MSDDQPDTGPPKGTNTGKSASHSGVPITRRHKREQSPTNSPTPWTNAIPLDHGTEAAPSVMVTMPTACLLVASFLIIQIFGTLLAFAVAGLLGVANPQASSMTVLSGLILTDIIMLILLGHMLKAKSRFSAMGVLSASRLPPLFTWGLSFGVLGAAMLFGALYSFYAIPDQTVQPVIADLIEGARETLIGEILIIAIIAVGAPIIEELVFRGFLQNALKAYVSDHAAIWIAAGIFGFIHFEMIALPALIALGAAFGYIYHYTGALWLAMLAHAINNGIALAASMSGS